jgi:hypothetical protein
MTMSWCKGNTRFAPVLDLRKSTVWSAKEGHVDQKDSMNRDREDENLDLDMERDTQIRRDTQVRGSLGIPPSGGSGSRESGDSGNRDEAVPEFERGSDEDRGSER